MHVFIDESGSFTGNPGQHGPSALGALIIPDCKLANIERKYQTLRSSLPKQKGEVKGRLLSEVEVNRIVQMLARNDVLFEISVVDLGMHTKEDISSHQAGQAFGLTSGLTEKHHSSLIREVWELRAQLENMPPQLYIQSVVTFELIDRAIRHATLYFCQRIPRELGSFRWIVDAKNKARVTDWENWWTLCVKPMLQTKSLRDPFPMFEEGDYSHFDRFSRPLPEYLTEHLGEDGPKDGTDLQLVLEDIRFSASPEPGLELVDIVTNAVRRALAGNLTIEGWSLIPRLMIHQQRHYIQLLTLAKDPLRPNRAAYQPVLDHFTRGGKTMMAPRFRD